MTENYTEIDILIAKQLAGEADIEEQQALEAWIAGSEENKLYFDALERLWQQAPQARVGPSWEVDTEAALQKVKKNILQKKAPTLTIRSVGFWVRAAAAIVLILLAFWPPNSQPQPSIASTDATLTDTLTDGSVVVLNRNSGLRIADNFNRKERRMRLSGEAYFQVAHDTVRPFVVEAEQLEISVVGTEFNVDNKPGSGSISVSVTSGKVLLRTTRQTELLTAGQQALYDKANGNITRLVQPEPNVLAYKTRIFDFDETSLQTVVDQLSAVYGVNITLKNKALANCPLSTRFKQLELDQVLEIIAESFSLTVERTATGIVLHGEGCPEKK